MSEAPRTSPQEAHARMRSGKAILVCAYDDDEKCGRMHLDDALTLNELRRRLRDLPSDTELIFYCA